MRINPSPRIVAVGSIATLLLCACGALLNRPAFFAAWLAAWWFWMGLGLGAQGNLWIHRLTGGRWIEPIAAPLNRMRSGLPFVGILIVPILLWPGVLFPWAREGWTDDVVHTAFRSAWLTPHGLALRTLAWVALWTLLTRWRPQAPRSAGTGFAACGLLLFGYSISLAATDLLMSLTPQWYSSGFGLLILTAQLKAAMSGAVLLGAEDASPPIRGDLGNFLLTYVMTWAYLAFTQFQIIWAENLPGEISWFVPRMQTAWAWMGLALAAVGFGVPMALLIFRGFKRSAYCLRTLAGLLLLMSWVETMWWILPSTGAASLHILWMLPLATAGMGGIAIAAGLAFPCRPPRTANAARTEERHA